MLTRLTPVARLSDMQCEAGPQPTDIFGGGKMM